MSQPMERMTEVDKITVHATAASAEVKDFSKWAGGRVFIPTGFVSTALTVYEYNPGTTNVEPAYDEFGVAVTISIGGTVRSYPIPETMFGCHKIALVASSSSDNDKKLSITLKS